VADIGAGTGYFVPHLARAVGVDGRVIAIDIEDDMVRYLKERAEREGFSNVMARKGSPGDAMLEPASVDRILIVNTWHHIPERTSYARKLADSLRPQGSVFVVDYTMDSPQGPPKSHRMPPEQVLRELAAGGLDAKIVGEDLPYQYVVVGTKK
jgi:ubiquinone/menaquinone biosynthesis C-methylase UbiE